MQQQDFADVNGTRLYYEVAGSGPPLALIHGFSLDTRMWDDQFEAFAQHYRVIRWDVRGFGKSTPPAGEQYTPAADLKALLEHLGIAGAHILGLSMGGGIALDFALMYPEATRALIAVDSALGGFRWSQEWDASLERIWSRGRQGDTEAAKKLWLGHPLFAPAMQNPAIAPRLAQIVSDYSGWHWVNSDPRRGAHPPASKRLGDICAPTLILVGERDLPDFHTISDSLQRQIANARKVVVPGVGHMVNMEAPARFNEAVLSFLAGL